MEHPKTYLLKNILQSPNNGRESLRFLNGRHIEDLVQVMEEFATKSVIEAIDRLNKGETINVAGKLIKLTVK